MSYQRVSNARKAQIRAFLGVLLVILLALPADAAKGANWFKQGKKAEVAGDLDQALSFYEKALSEDGKNTQYVVNVRRIRFLASFQHVDRGHKLREKGQVEEALAEFQKAFALDPSSTIADIEIRRTLPMVEARKAGPKPGDSLTPQQASQRATETKLLTAEQPAELMPISRNPINLRATNDSKILFETIGKLAGINVLADPDYQSKRTSVELNNVTLEDAFDYVGVLSKTYWKPLTGNTILIYGDSKKRDHDPQVVKTVYLTNIIQPQEITEITQTLRNLLEMNKLQQVNSQNAIVLMGTPEKVAIAEKIINDVDKAKPEVVVDVTVMQVNRNLTRNLGLTPVSGGAPGIQIPGVFNPQNVVAGATGASGATGSTGTTGTFVTIPRLGRLSSADFSTTVPGAALNALMTDSNTKILQNPQVRVSDGVAAKLRIGQRIPIATGSFQPGIGGVGINPLVNTQFQYTDVGVILEITPKVHAGKEVSMKVAVEISSVDSRVNIGGIDQPVIGQRRVEEEIRLREGEANVLGGIIQNSLSISKAGVPFLGEIPLLGRLFSTETKETVESEVLIVLTPRVVRVPDITELNMRAIDAGTQTNIGLKFRPPAPPPGVTPASAFPKPLAPTASTPATAVPALPTPGAPVVTAPPNAPVTPPAGPPTGPPVTTPTVMTPAATSPSETPPAPSGPPALIRIADIKPQDVGATFTVDIELVGAQNIHRVPLQIAFDQSKMKLMNAVAGNLLAKDGKPVAVTQTVDPEKSIATVVVSRPPGADPVSGTGPVVTLTFQATNRGTGRIEVSGTTRGPKDETQVLTPLRANVQILR